MQGKAPADARVQALQATLAPLADTIGRLPGATIRPPQRKPDTGEREALAQLASAGIHPETGLVLEDTLGTGGMGIVRLGEQRSLHRKVAVKTLRDDRFGEAEVLSLMQEAWITGALEHPNVMPVYDIEIDATGRPMVVLKRIEGEPWTTLLADPERVRAQRGEQPLIWHLGVLLQVCNALRFAHERGILHRDIKPDNVMVGAYGEVYLLDWGIAVALDDDADERLPRVVAANAVAGTPAYMAPEMMGGDGAQLTRRTDVYLLGAVLYEILVGRPPHDATSLGQLVLSATQVPTLPDDAPKELAALCRRAMDPDPAVRPASVDLVREAIRDFLRHRSSAELTDRAELSRAALEGVLATEPPDVVAHRLQVYNLFTECRFGYREALTSWAANPVAQRGQRAAVLAMVAYELSAGDAPAAAALLAEVGDPPAELRQRVDEAIAEAEARGDELSRLRERARQQDPRLGARTRSGVAMILGLSFVAVPLWGHFDPWIHEDPDVFIWFPLGLLLALVGINWWARESLGKTSINRRLMASIIFLSVAEAFFGFAFRVMGLEMLTFELCHVVSALLVTGLMSIYIDRWIAVPTVGYAGALLACVAWTDYRYVWFAVANAVLTLTLVSRWRPRDEEARRVSAS
ncbi:MAG: serine/threonine protein kinase [Deltaproteobacteria bacterium]|nr:serine/threonine protein kinase [Deltaproteobacteria bacterium]